MRHDRHVIPVVQIFGCCGMVWVGMGQENGFDSSAELDQMVDLPAEVAEFQFVACAGSIT